MIERRAGPPIMGLLFLGAAAGCVGWAATAETDPVIDHAPAVQAASVDVAGAAASRTADFNRRTIPD